MTIKLLSCVMKHKNAICNISYLHVKNSFFKSSVRCYSYRSHMCGELTKEQIGKTVTVCGWIHGFRMNKFMLLRDHTGVVQVVYSGEEGQCMTEKELSDLNVESVLKLVGLVACRPSGQENLRMPTGFIELIPQSFEILNKAKVLPFQIKKASHKGEAIRQKYRYLDIRTEHMQRNLRLRAQLISNLRKFLEECSFIEVETPTLFCPTPGGAQEFIVPSSRIPGKFFSLPQSPQQLKQLLMIGGIDRYYQVARCYRDEHSKSDRQFEFTQLDLEMSFVNRNDVLTLIENLIRTSWPVVLSNEPFPVLTYDEAMSMYGTDKPDIRYGYKFQNISQFAPNTLTNLLKANFINAITFDKAESSFTPKLREKLSKSLSLQCPNHCSFAYLAFIDGRWKVSPSKLRFISDLINLPELINFLNMKECDVAVLSFGEKEDVQKTLGCIRSCVINLFIDRNLIVKSNNHNFLWVVDFPLFEKGETSNSLKSVHHPFTAPHEDDLALLETKPLSARSLAYDLVLNGEEVGGGSMRIHNAEMQRLIFDILHLNPKDLFYLFDALESGAPPHGGIALGIDRIAAILCGAESIRDVIAFPKASNGIDTMTNTPCEISESLKSSFHIKSSP